MPSFSFAPLRRFPTQTHLEGSRRRRLHFPRKRKETSHKSLLDSIPHQRRRVGKQGPPSFSFLFSNVRPQRGKRGRRSGAWNCLRSLLLLLRRLQRLFFAILPSLKAEVEKGRGGDSKQKKTCWWKILKTGGLMKVWKSLEAANTSSNSCSISYNCSISSNNTGSSSFGKNEKSSPCKGSKF